MTGNKSVYKPLTLYKYFNLEILGDPEVKVGHSAVYDDPILFTIRQNFSGFINTWKYNLTKGDYKLLDEILQRRVKSEGVGGEDGLHGCASVCLERLSRWYLEKAIHDRGWSSSRVVR